jgi:hypothetical protein
MKIHRLAASHRVGPSLWKSQMAALGRKRTCSFSDRCRRDRGTYTAENGDQLTVLHVLHAGGAELPPELPLFTRGSLPDGMSSWILRDTMTSSQNDWLHGAIARMHQLVGGEAAGPFLVDPRSLYTPDTGRTIEGYLISAVQPQQLSSAIGMTEEWLRFQSPIFFHLRRLRSLQLESPLHHRRCSECHLDRSATV